MGSRGHIQQKYPTPFPGVEIIDYELRDDLQLRVKLTKPKVKYIHRTLGTKDPAEGLSKAAEVYMQIVQNPDEFSRNSLTQIPALVDKFIDQQQQRVIRREIAEGTLKGKDRTLYKGLIPFCKAHDILRVSQVTHTSFSTYPVWRIDTQSLKNETVNTEIRHLKEFLYWCQKSEGHWKGYEWLLMPVRRVKSGPKPNSAFTDEMVEEMTDFLLDRSRDKSISVYQRWRWTLFTHFINIMCESGMRTGELVNVKWGDIRIRNWDPNEEWSKAKVLLAECDIHVTTSKTGPRDILVRTPGFIHLRAMYQDKGFKLGPQNYVFTNILNGKPMTTQVFTACFKEMRSELGWGEEFTLYSSRSTYISDAIIQGVPLSMIAQQCGNSSAMIEDRYRDIILKKNSDILLGRTDRDKTESEFRSIL